MDRRAKSLPHFLENATDTAKSWISSFLENAGTLIVGEATILHIDADAAIRDDDK